MGQQPVAPNTWRCRGESHSLGISEAFGFAAELFDKNAILLLKALDSRLDRNAITHACRRNTHVHFVNQDVHTWYGIEFDRFNGVRKNKVTITITMIHSDGAAWYCARTKPKCEHIAVAGLVRRLGLEVFHPRMRLERATRRGPVRVVEPLFPGYVFVRCSVADGFDKVQYMLGVRGLVRFGQRVATVPERVIDELRQLFGSGDPMCVGDRLCAGSEVTVAEGSFLGSSGIVVRVLSAKQRVQILLDFLGRPILAEVDRKSLTLDERRMADLVPALARTQQECVQAAA